MFMLHKTASRIGPFMIARMFVPGIIVVLAACAQNAVQPIVESPTLEQLRADNAPAVNLFGSDGSGIALLIRNVYDLNRNGRIDAEETAIPNWGIRLTRIDAQGAALEASELQRTPESNGKRWQGVLLNVPAGRYRLEELSPRPLSGPDLSWNVTQTATREVLLEGTQPGSVEFTSVCLENGEALGFPDPNEAWRCKPEFDLAPRIVSFAVSPNEVKAGERPKFTWSVADHATLEIDEGIGSLEKQTGSLELDALDSARYTLTARNAFGSSRAQASLRVLPKALSGTFSSAGSTPFGVYPGNAGALYVSVPGIGLNNSQVVVGKTPRESSAQDAPLQARIQGLYRYDSGSGSFTALGQVINPNDPGYRYTLEDAVPLEDGKAMLRKIPEITHANDPREYEVYDFVTDEHIAVTGPKGPTVEAGDDPNHPAYLKRQFISGGKVLLVIACAGNPVGVKVETYDPKTQTSTTSNCATDPQNQIPYSEFTPLSNGQFLVTGGLDQFPINARKATALARIYDPARASFRRLSNMNFARYRYSTTTLKDGRILFTGGTGVDTVQIPIAYVASSEIFDPRSEKFTTVGGLLEGRLEHKTFVLPGGQVLLLDGNHINDPSAQTVYKPELFDPLTGIFSATGEMLEPRGGFSAVQLKDGRVFVYGGTSSDGIGLSSAEIYNP
jgi:hypothetical protein